MKSAFVIFADGFEDVEAITPVDYLRRSGVSVTTVGLIVRTVVSAHQISIICDKDLSEVAGLPLPDLVVLPGGGRGSENLAASEALRFLVTRMMKEQRLVGAICASPAVVLYPWGLLEGRSYTCYGSLGDHFTVKPSKSRLVVDLNLITARAAGVAEEFSLALVRALCGEKMATEVGDAILAR